MLQNNSTLVKTFKDSNRIIVYNQGKEFNYLKGDDKYELILSYLYEITNNSYEMPAFSVADDNSTIKAIQTGLWLELEFSNTKHINDLPFDSLLIEVNPDFSGFNLIRKHNGKYDGRCFYLNLKTTMNSLYKNLKLITKE